MAKIIIVGSETETTEYMKNILADHVLSIITAKNGRECIEKAIHEKPSIVITDVILPDMSVWDLFNKLRAFNENIRVILTSAIEISPERKECLLRKGIYDYIMKPFGHDELIDILGKHGVFNESVGEI